MGCAPVHEFELTTLRGGGKPEQERFDEARVGGYSLPVNLNLNLLLSSALLLCGAAVGF
jgi:hypothetical protein